MPKVRVGVALMIQGELRSEIQGLRRALGDPNLTRIAPHLTLVPPLNLSDQLVPQALEVLRNAASTTEEFPVELGPIATFWPASPVVYLPCRIGWKNVVALRNKVFQAPLFRPPSWPYVPHVTLAEVQQPKAEAALEEAERQGDRRSTKSTIDAILSTLGSFEARATFGKIDLLVQNGLGSWSTLADAAFGGRPRIVGRGTLPTELSISGRDDPQVSRWLEDMLSVGPADDVLGQWCDPVSLEVIVARRDGQIVGLAHVDLGSESARLLRLHVDPAHRRQGVGSQLLAAAVSDAARTGCTQIEAYVRSNNVALEFARSRGWKNSCHSSQSCQGEFLSLRRIVS